MQELINQVKDLQHEVSGLDTNNTTLNLIVKDLTGQVIALRELTQRHEKEIRKLQIDLAQTRHALAERLAYK